MSSILNLLTKSLILQNCLINYINKNIHMNNNSKMFREFSKIVLEIYHKQLRTINRNFPINNICQLGSIAATRALRKIKINH